MRWRYLDVSGGPVDCVCCGEASTDLFVLGGMDEHTPPEDIEAFDKAFGLDALADFGICVDCWAEYGPGSKDPMEWLRVYLAEDRKLISRKKALRILDGMKGD
jgi:hypothetical protein